MRAATIAALPAAMVTRDASEPMAMGEVSVSGGRRGCGPGGIQFVRNDLAEHGHRALAHVGIRRS